MREWITKCWPKNINKETLKKKRITLIETALFM